MAERTPLEALDDAIHEYIRAVVGENDTRAVAGWVVGIETTSLIFEEDALPLADAQHYASGPQTTVSQAIGLSRYVAGVYETWAVNGALGRR